MRLKRFVICIVGLLALAGCGTLPNDGPSAKVVEEHAKVEAQSRYSMINLDYPVTQAILQTPAAVPVGLAGADSDAPTDLIGVGDTLSVTVFEAGSVPLFPRGGASATAGSTTSSTAGGQAQDTFPHVVVDRNGMLNLPFAGAIPVDGLTTQDAGVVIQAALRGRVVSPQVLVNILTSTANSVSVLGEVRSPGRFPISAHNNRLLDIIAAAGGPTKPLGDIRVVVVRGDQSVEAPLGLLMERTAQNIRLAPHDQVRLMSHERKFSTFGAFGHVTEGLIQDEHLSLAAAISRNGGLDTYSADNSAVFVFRFERLEVATALGAVAPVSAKGVPVIYRLDMRDPNSYFIANSFEIEPDDLVYVPRASSIGVKKFLDLVSVVTNVTYTAAVTSSNVP